MKAEIIKSTACGRIDAPASKSYAHRELICAALADGVSTLHGVPQNDDVMATAEALRAFGAKITEVDGALTVEGVGGEILAREKKKERIIDCRESGSTLRFLLPLATVLGEKTVFLGSGRLMERPLDIYGDICRKHKIEFRAEGNTLTVGGGLHGGKFRFRGDVSSQFVTGLLFVLPFLDGYSKIELIPPVESRQYIDITLDVLEKFGIRVSESSGVFTLDGGRKYLPSEVNVEGDYSSAAFLEAFGLIGGNVTAGNLDEKSLQGDKKYRDIFAVLRERAKRISPDEPDVLPEFDLSDCPDLAPVTMALSAMLGGALLRGTARLRFKESDRGAAMQTELAKFGARVSVSDDSILIAPAKLHTPSEILSSHGDHRIAMSLALVCSAFGGIIDGAECVSKSYPDFWRDIMSLGIKVDLRGNR